MKNFALILTSVLLFFVNCSSPDNKTTVEKSAIEVELDRITDKFYAEKLNNELENIQWKKTIDSLNIIIKHQESEILNLKEKLKQKK